MTKVMADDRAEPKAKAALLDFLRSRGSLDRRSVVTTELILDKQAVRADVVICGPNDLHCFEIKTERDTLSRLDRKLQIYSKHADFVTVAAATRHINAVISRVAAHVGIYEIVTFSPANELRIVREPQRSPVSDANAMLSLMPVAELRTRLGLSGRAKRDETVAEAQTLPDEQKKKAVLSFLRERYEANSRSLLQAPKRRQIRPVDLMLLRRWGRANVENGGPAITEVSAQLSVCPDAEAYNHVGRSFGPVPEEVRALFAD